jgi:uncharacterized membrane protein YkoI
MRLSLALVVASGVLAAGSASAQAPEEKLTLQDLPPAVQAAVKAQLQGGTVRGLAKEIENGATVYEAELTVQGRNKDIIVDAEGKVLVVEDQTTLEAIPAPARTAIQKAVGKGKLTLVEKVTKGQTIFYEGHVTNGAEILEVAVDAEGKPVE